MYKIQTITEMMHSSGLEISKIWPIRVWDHSPGGGTWTFPSLSHIEIIPTLWKILHQIEQDWIAAASEYSFSKRIDRNCDYTQFMFHAFEELKPRYIQCLFSYINFFFTLENGFQVFYDELKRFKDELSLPLKIEKKPKRPPYIQEKLRLVRNHTVIHWGGPGKKHDINSQAGRMWGFSRSSDADTLTELCFGNTSLVGAEDRVLKSIPETHKICTDYLNLYDERSSDLLKRIVSHLPMKVGTKEYVYTEPSK